VITVAASRFAEFKNYATSLNRLTCCHDLK
jgi:hypothetical protein